MREFAERVNNLYSGVTCREHGQGQRHHTSDARLAIPERDGLGGAVRGTAGPPVGLAEIRLSSSALNCITCREHDTPGVITMTRVFIITWWIK